MDKLKMVSFRFTEEDSRKLDVLCNAAQSKHSGGVFPLRINRTSVLQNLISLAYIAFTEEEAKAVKSIDRAKKKAKGQGKAV